MECYRFMSASHARPRSSASFDYKSNVALYPTFQNYFRTHKPRLKRDVPDAVIRFFDTANSRLRRMPPRSRWPFATSCTEPGRNTMKKSIALVTCANGGEAKSLWRDPQTKTGGPEGPPATLVFDVLLAT